MRCAYAPKLPKEKCASPRNKCHTSTIAMARPRTPSSVLIRGAEVRERSGKRLPEVEGESGTQAGLKLLFRAVSCPTNGLAASRRESM